MRCGFLGGFYDLQASCVLVFGAIAGCVVWCIRVLVFRLGWIWFSCDFGFSVWVVLYYEFGVAVSVLVAGCSIAFWLLVVWVLVVVGPGFDVEFCVLVLWLVLLSVGVAMWYLSGFGLCSGFLVGLV